MREWMIATDEEYWILDAVDSSFSLFCEHKPASGDRSIQQSTAIRYAALHTIKRNSAHDNNEYEFPSEQQQQ